MARPVVVPVLREVDGSPEEQMKEADLAKIARFIRKLQDRGLYGKVAIGFQHGRLTTIQLEQTFKADEL
jgi:hypothetical protein